MVTTGVSGHTCLITADTTYLFNGLIIEVLQPRPTQLQVIDKRGTEGLTSVSFLDLPSRTIQVGACFKGTPLFCVFEGKPKGQPRFWATPKKQRKRHAHVMCVLVEAVFVETKWETSPWGCQKLGLQTRSLRSRDPTEPLPLLCT